MRKQIDQVREFHLAFGVPILNLPMITSNRVEMRQRILEEEVKELRKASYNGDVVEVADALCDVIYIAIGTACEFGLQNFLEKCFDEVHLSNMSKLDENGLPILREDGKVIKSKLYSPPNLKQFISVTQHNNHGK